VAITGETLSVVFLGLVRKSNKEQKSVLTPSSEEYIVGVLCGFVSAPEVLPGSIYPGDLLRLASDTGGPERAEYLKLSGDIAMFVAGIFPEALANRRRAVTIRDYIDIGSSAYGQVGGVPFSELSNSFSEVVNVLNEVSIEIDLTKRDLQRYLFIRRQIDASLARR